MRSFMFNPSELTGGDSSRVQTGMENDPTADEEVIDQRDGLSSQENYPEPVNSDQINQDETKTAKLAPDDLADSIAYALDGSGPGPTNTKPNVSGHDVITEGTSGSGPEEEERIFGK